MRMFRVQLLIVLSLALPSRLFSWMLRHEALSPRIRRLTYLTESPPWCHLYSSVNNDSSGADLDDLREMDVVIYSELSNPLLRQLGAVQEDGRITPVCVWTTEPAYGESLEFLVDEEDMLPGFRLEQIQIHMIVPESALYYGSRQVGGGMGPDNPHGEISELLYYVDQSILDNVEIKVKPELEIFW